MRLEKNLVTLKSDKPSVEVILSILRFGYWNQVDVKKLNEILKPLNEVQEDEWYDDDCGNNIITNYCKIIHFLLGSLDFFSYIYYVNE